MTTTTRAAVPEHVGADLILRTVKLSGLKDTLPERLTLFPPTLSRRM